MQKIKIFFFYSFLIWFNCVISQTFTIEPDSLKKYSYLDLNAKMISNPDKNPEISKRNYIYAKTCLLRAKKEDNIEEIFYGYDVMSKQFNDFKLILKYSDSMIITANKYIPSKITYAYFRRGQMFYDAKDLKKSLNYFLVANKNSSSNSKDLNNRIQYSIGLIKNTQGNYDEALKIYRKCEETARINKFVNHLNCLFGLAEVCNRMNLIDESEKYTNMGMNVIKVDNNRKAFYPYFIANQGKNFYKRKEYNKAIHDLISALPAIKMDDDFTNYAENCFFIGESYRESNQEEKAIIYYKKVDSIFAVKNDIYPLNAPAYDHLIAYYKKKKDYKQVIHYSDQFIKADKVINDNYKYITSKIAKNYDIHQVVSDKQAVINLLESNNEKSIFINISLLLTIIALGYWFYKNSKQKKIEFERQKILYESYIEEREQKIKTEKIKSELYKEEIVKKRTISDIDESIVSYLSSCLIKFEDEEWFLESYNIEDLSYALKTNSRYLSTVINEIKGCTYVQYVNKLRIKYIINKLETDKEYLGYSIQKLSKSCGYNSVETFARVFKEHTKMNPSEFIKQLKTK